MARFQVSKSHNYLLRDGDRFFYLADTVWAAFAHLSLNQWRDYLTYRRAQGFNAVQISILPITHDRSTSEDSDDPFSTGGDGSWDFYRLEEAYFDKAEQMVAMAVEADIAPMLGVLWTCYVPDTRASQISTVPSAMPLDAVEAYAEHAAKRFGKYEPIFFISGDTAWDSDRESSYYMAALDIIRETCPASLTTMHMSPSADLPAEFAEKVDFYMYQSGHGPDQKTPFELGRKFGAHAIKRPVVNGEPCYEGHGKGATRTRFRAFDVRKATWQSLLSGAGMGMTYGGHGVWSCHFEGMGFVRPERKFTPYVWEEALRLPGAWDVAYARWLWEQFDLFDIEAVDLLEGDEEVEVVLAASSGLDKIALYMPHAHDVALRVDLSGYRCTVIDLDNRRPMIPVVDAGPVSTVRMAMFNGDALFVAVR